MSFSCSKTSMAPYCLYRIKPELLGMICSTLPSLSPLYLVSTLIIPVSFPVIPKRLLEQSTIHSFSGYLQLDTGYTTVNKQNQGPVFIDFLFQRGKQKTHTLFVQLCLHMPISPPEEISLPSTSTSFPFQELAFKHFV